MARRSTSSARSSMPDACRPRHSNTHRQVADCFTDAAGAISFYTREDLKVARRSRWCDRRLSRERRWSQACLEACTGGSRIKNRAWRRELPKLAKADVTVYRST